MDIVILSGKGGTGKTTVSTNLSQVMDYAYIDCDVEEPNGYIFLKPDHTNTHEVCLLNPEFTDACTFCGKCVEACEYNAIVSMLDRMMLFEDLCHGCGACKLACPVDAIREIERPIGLVKTSDDFGMGLLNLKEPMGGPIISKLKSITKDYKNRILDAPPGVSCSVVKACEDADFAVLVTEPTQFGLHDLRKAVDLVRTLKIPFGVVINRYDGPSFMDEYLLDDKIECLGRIPFSKEAAVMYSEGKMLIEDEKLHGTFLEIARAVQRRLS
ncbi:(4Fe-4S)-binding protein [Acidaminobacter sp. JC074]|uniref:4Fe-4S binding protein n=1 Tax=Acidaminobacter sp. JC074 TaxID=2530199 RepID=UPI001F112628|nr:ATP-binding protein [Acidaminobacter sp. JC074]MCH4889356.1 (4Fe-4S)-binding protein [Acidaminobacter sp. JC074]